MINFKNLKGYTKPVLRHLRWVENYVFFRTRPSIAFARRYFNKKTKLIAEVGVKEGWHARSMAEALNPLKIYLIDIKKYSQVSRFLKKISYEFIEQPSIKAAKRFSNESLDLVYIDANHSEEAVTQDIKIWYSKVKMGGILCGHDYIPIFAVHEKGVKKTVDKIFPHVQSFLSDWWVIKNENTKR